MDPLSITGLILSVGQCIQPFIALLRAVVEYRQIEETISEALNKTVLCCKRIELTLNDLSLIDESSIASGHKTFLHIALDQFHSEVLSHRAAVDSWIRRLGLSDKLTVGGVSYRDITPAPSLAPATDTTVTEDDIDIRHCIVFGWRIRALSITFKSRRKGRKVTTSHASEPNNLGKVGKTDLGTRIVRMANKLGFVVIGKETIAGMTRNLEFWNDIILGGIMSAIGSLTFKFFRSPKAPVGLRIAHPITRFIVQAKIRDAEGRNVTRISFEEWKEHYQGLQRLEYIDDNTAGLTKQFQIYSGDAIPRQVDISTVLTGRFPDLRNCVFVDRGIWNEKEAEDTLRLGRLFADEEDNASRSSSNLFRSREDGDMLRCIAAVRILRKSFLVFQLPQGSASEPKTLRTLLLDKRGTSEFGRYPLTSLVDRAKLALRMATAIFVVHSLGLVHKQVNPETILMVESAASSKRFPRRLGYPYLIAFHTAHRELDSTAGPDLDPSDIGQYITDAAHRDIYYQPRFREGRLRRNDRPRMLDDIFALGVCLFEVGLWRSLFVWDGKRNYVHDDAFVPLSDTCGKWDGMGISEKAEARTNELIRVVEEILPGAMGPVYTKAVVACLRAGTEDSPFYGHPSLTEDGDSTSESGEVTLLDADDTQSDGEAPKPVSISYLELVLQSLQAVHKALEGKAG